MSNRRHSRKSASEESQRSQARVDRATMTAGVAVVVAGAAEEAVVRAAAPVAACPVAVAVARPPPAGGGNDLREWGKKLESLDPLTREQVKDDYRFVLEVVVRKRNTPDDKIPEEYKAKKDIGKNDSNAKDQQG